MMDNAYMAQLRAAAAAQMAATIQRHYTATAIYAELVRLACHDLATAESQVEVDAGGLAGVAVSLADLLLAELRRPPGQIPPPPPPDSAAAN